MAAAGPRGPEQDPAYRPAPPSPTRCGMGRMSDGARSVECSTELFPSVVRAPHERTGLDVADAERLAGPLVLGELLGPHPPVHRQVEPRGLEVLAHGHDVAARL